MAVSRDLSSAPLSVVSITMENSERVLVWIGGNSSIGPHLGERKSETRVWGFASAGHDEAGEQGNGARSAGYVLSWRGNGEGDGLNGRVCFAERVRGDGDGFLLEAMGRAPMGVWNGDGASGGEESG